MTHSCIRPFFVLTLPWAEVQVLETVSNLREASVSSVILQLPSIFACVTKLLLDYFEKEPRIHFVTYNPSAPVLLWNMLGLRCS